MNDLNEALKEFGLTGTEADVYLAGLARPAIDVQTLVRQTGIKRPTVYHALETLMQKGLASKHGTARKLEFAMTSPDRLERLLEQEIENIQKRRERLKQVVPLLKQHTQTETAPSTNVVQYEGIEGIKNVVEEALYCRSRRWDLLAPSKNFFSEFDRAYGRYFLETRLKRGITARTLWERGAKEIGRPLTAEELRQRDPRYLPKSLQGTFKSVIILFDDKAAIVSSLQGLSAILIQSKEAHEMLTAMFNGLWAISEPYEK
jgi:sugar-specific transcriptional regulator TrmB